MGLESVTTGAALILQQLVVEGEAADEDPDVGARQSVGGYSPVLQGFPRGLQQEALLRIERVRLARRDAEELRIELIDLAEESTSPGDDLADLRSGSDRGIALRSSVFRERRKWRRFRYTASSTELSGGVGAARKATADPDDGQGLVGPCSARAFTYRR